MPIDPTLNRWPRIREDIVCPDCAGPKMPSTLMCAPCFDKNKVGSGGISKMTRFTPEMERRLNMIENNLEDSSDQWAAAFDGFDEAMAALGIKW